MKFPQHRNSIPSHESFYFPNIKLTHHKKDHFTLIGVLKLIFLNKVIFWQCLAYILRFALNFYIYPYLPKCQKLKRDKIVLNMAVRTINNLYSLCNFSWVTSRHKNMISSLSYFFMKKENRCIYYYTKHLFLLDVLCI